MSAASDLARQIGIERRYMGFSVPEVAGVLRCSEADFIAMEDGSRLVTIREQCLLARLFGTTVDHLRGAPVPVSLITEKMPNLHPIDKYAIDRFSQFLSELGSH